MSDCPDYEAAAKHYRYMSYLRDGREAERPWSRLAPGAKNSWILIAKPLVDAAFNGEPIYRIREGLEHTHDDDDPSTAAMCLMCMIDLHIADGELVQVYPKGDDE